MAINKVVKASFYSIVLFIITLGFSGCNSITKIANSGKMKIEGELKVWHKVTISLDGPQTSEQATPNPFMDYRLQALFIGPSKQQYNVPGYFAADGDSANTSSDSGNKWRIHFAPDQVGKWTCKISFRTGTNIAVSDDYTIGEPIDGLDGQSFTFKVSKSDKTGRDFRGRGMLSYRGKHYLQFAGTGKLFKNDDYFLKCGVDAPENFLAYADFDGPFKTDGIKDNLIKTWEPHVSDWKNGDPVWQNDKGKGMIGALNYLASEGLNAFSFLTMNINGDDQNVFPYTDYHERNRMDVSKLAQWEIVFEQADKSGLFLHFKTQETENDHLLDNGELGPQRKLYYRELIARFGHHLALNWNLGEETTNTTKQLQDFCAYFASHDPYRHPVVVHTYPDQKEKVYTPLLWQKDGLQGVSLQTNFADFRAVHGDVLKWVKASSQTDIPWIVSCDEPGDPQHALVPDKDDSTHDNARMNALWGTVMAGGAGIEWYFGYGHDQSDLTCQDFRSRDEFWDQCRYMLEFFKNNKIPFWEMTNDDGLLSETNGYCFKKDAQIYIVYLKSAQGAKLTLPEGQYSIQWYNPRTGSDIQNVTKKTFLARESVLLDSPPSESNKDWVLVIRIDNDN